jgi:hypothetical protein
LTNEVEVYVKCFLDAVEKKLEKKDLWGVGEIVVSNNQGLGPGWNSDVETVYRFPANFQERELARRLNETLVMLANRFWLERSGDGEEILKSVWFCVCCLNKLGLRASPRLVDEVKGYIIGMKVTDEIDRRADQWRMLLSFLPAVLLR